MIRFNDFVDLGGCRLHATVRGNGPTVVMERGAECGGVYGPLLDNGSHMMSLDRPDAIVDAVREVIAAAGETSR